MRRRFVAKSFFLVAANKYSGPFWVFFGVATVNIISSVNKMMLTSFDEHFPQLFRMAGLARQFAATLSCEARRFLSRNISQGSVATQLRCCADI